MNTQILHIDSSLFGESGVSSQLSAYLIEKLISTHSNPGITKHSLAEENIPHFSLETINAVSEGKADLADRYIDEIKKADVLVLSAPMYNFAIPTQLKSWFDHIARAGTTFKYTDNGPKGLLENKKVYVITTRGGIHRGKETDTESLYLKTMLGFIGLTDVDFIYAEGLNMGAERETSILKAQHEIDVLFPNSEGNEHTQNNKVAV